MDSPPPNEIRQDGLGSWHPAMRPNTDPLDDMGANLPVNSFPNPPSAEENAEHVSASHHLPLRSKSTSESQPINNVPLVDSSQNVRSLPNVDVDAADEAVALRLDLESPTDVGKKHTVGMSESGRQIDQLLGAKYTGAAMSGSDNTVGSVTDDSIPDTARSIVENFDRPTGHPTSEESLSRRHEMDRVWEMEEGAKSRSNAASVSRTNSFPVVPQMRERSNQIPSSLPHSQAETLVKDNKDEDSSSLKPSTETDCADNTNVQLLDDPSASISGDEDGSFFGKIRSGEGFVASEPDEESRYEEGLPLMTASKGNLPDELSSGTVDGRVGEANAEKPLETYEEALSRLPGDEPALVPYPLDRKSTDQVLGSMQYTHKDAAFSPPDIIDAKSVSQDVEERDVVNSISPKDEQVTAKQEANDKTSKSDDENLAEMWKAALGDDDLLVENEKSVDPSAFFGEDDEGFLDDEQTQLGELHSQFQASEPSEPTHGFAAKDQGIAETKPQHLDSQNRYLPANAPQTVSHPRTVQSMSESYGAGRSPLASRETQKPQSYLAQQLSRPQMPASTQSFADKSKGGYTSPYDLPMDVTRPKKRSPHQQIHSSSDAQPPSNRPAPPRSSSMFTGASPPIQSQPPMPRLSSAYLPAKIGNSVAPTPKSSANMSGFFEDLPVTKSRPTSSMGKFISPAYQANPSPPAPSKLGPSNQYSLAQSSPSITPNSQQQYELLPPERMSLYGNTGQAEPPNRVIPTTNARYSPAPAQPSGVPPPQNRYAASPASGSRPPISQTLPFQPRTSSPLAQNHSVLQGRQQNSMYDTSSQKPQSSGKQNVPLGDIDKSHFQPSPMVGARGMHSEPRRAQISDTIDPSEIISSPPLPSSNQDPELSDAASHLSQGLRNSRPDHLFPDTSTSFTHSQETLASDIEVPVHGPPKRSQTQSPGALRYLPQSTNVQAPLQRPASASHELLNKTVNPIPPLSSHPKHHTMAPQSGFNYIQPNDGQELDDLERWKGCPIFSFGFGGAIVTSFPKQIPRYATGQAVPMIKCSPGEVKLQDAKILPLEEVIAAFPGPLKSKSKKKDVVDWLNKRISKLEEDTSFLANNRTLPDPNKCHEEKLILWQIVRAVVEHDGVLDGTPSMEQAIRSILSPELTQGDTAVLPNRIYNAPLLGIVRRSEARTIPDAVDPTALETLRKILLHGDRERAVWHAVDNRLWAHAMLLSSTLDQRVWKQVSQEFVRQEVKTYGDNTEALAALYQIFTGNCEESADELVPPSARAGLQMVSKSASTGPTKNALDGLDRWRETLTLALSNRTPDDGKALLSLGQLLASYGRIEAAHVCYIFAKTSGLFGGPDDPHVSIALLGANHVQHPNDYGRDIDSILLTEVYDFARTVLASSSTATVSPHLQSLKLYHAMMLAEYGFKIEAQQYCEVIASTLNSTTKRSPYYHALLLESLNGLTERLRQAPRDTSGSWISKPSIDKVSGSIWAKFNQYVAGDESDAASVGSGKGHESTAGPFAGVAGDSPTLSRAPSSNDLYSSYVPSSGITPSIPFTKPTNPRYAPSGLYTPRSSLEQQGRPSQDPQRSGTHDSLRPALPQQQYQSRPNSSTSSSYEPSKAGSTIPAHPSGAESYLPTPPLQPQHMPVEPVEQPSSIYHHATQQPTPPSQLQELHEPYLPQNDFASSYGFAPPSSSDNPVSSAHTQSDPSLYQPPTLSSYEPPSQDADSSLGQESPSERNRNKSSYLDDEDIDDFEARAAAIRREEKARKDREADEAFRRAAEADAQKDKAPKLNNKKSGWFGGWLGGKKTENEDLHGTPNAPIKAKLGEQSSFYYDSEQKRWINKKDPDATPAAKATPPPPRGAPSRAVSTSGQPAPSNSDSPPVPPLPSVTPAAPIAAAKVPMSNPSTHPPSRNPSRDSSPIINAALRPAAEAEALGAPSGPPSAPPSRPGTSMSTASSIDDLIGVPQARKGGTIKKGKKKGYVDVMAK
ncbi:vesicle coat component [Lecanora helva]